VLLEAIETPEGGTSEPLDLAQHTAYVPDYTDFTAESVYAADLRGNVWRFDLTPTSGSYAAPTKIAVLTDANGVGQPVTTRPMIEVDRGSKKRYIIIGTGRLLADSDIGSTQTQSLYAIIDGTSGLGGFFIAGTLPTGVSFPIGRSNLNANANLVNGIGASPSNPMGWYTDLGTASNGIAERININGTANGGVIAMGVNLPDGEPCKPSGTGRVLGFTLGQGKSVLVSGAGLVESAASTSMLRDLAILNVDGTLRLVAGDAKGGVGKVGWQLPAGIALKRLNWREVPTAD
jgi:type IV pilus assembly protein PilY1